MLFRREQSFFKLVRAAAPISRALIRLPDGIDLLEEVQAHLLVLFFVLKSLKQKRPGQEGIEIYAKEDPRDRRFLIRLPDRLIKQKDQSYSFPILSGAERGIFMTENKQRSEFGPKTRKNAENKGYAER